MSEKSVYFSAILVTTYPMIVGQVIRRRREVLGLLQEDLSEVMKISPSGWARIEAGESALGMNKLYQVAALLKDDPGSIINDADKVTSFLIGDGVIVKAQRPRPNKFARNLERGQYYLTGKRLKYAAMRALGAFGPGG